MNVNVANQFGGLAATFAFLSWLLMAVVNVSFASGVWLDAGDIRRTGGGKPFLAGPAVWAVATLFGGVFVAGVYWVVHHSSLRRADGGPDFGKAYDRGRWQKALQRLLAELPESRPRWADLLVEAKSLGLNPDWIRQTQLTEFALLVRHLVADGALTAEEHRVIELARDLIGLSKAEAEAQVQTVLAEAASFFGERAEDGERPSFGGN